MYALLFKNADSTGSCSSYLEVALDSLKLCCHNHEHIYVYDCHNEVRKSVTTVYSVDKLAEQPIRIDKSAYFSLQGTVKRSLTLTDKERLQMDM